MTLSALRMACSRTYPVAPEWAFEQVMEMDLTACFSRPFGVIPGVRGTDLRGRWCEPGQSRTVDLAGPGSFLETFTTLDRPRSFGYRLRRIAGPMRLVATGVDGLWTIEPAGTGTRVTWQWTLSPTRLGRAVAGPFAWMWRGYARQALDDLEPYLLGRADQTTGSR